jgi:hypothetical protein
MRMNASEIRSLMSRLERNGDDRRLATADADRVTAEVADMLAAAIELTEDQADELWARDSASFSDLTREEHDERAQRAVGGNRRPGRTLQPGKTACK